jgi:hypothetical protein
MDANGASIIIGQQEGAAVSALMSLTTSGRVAVDLVAWMVNKSCVFGRKVSHIARSKSTSWLAEGYARTDGLVGPVKIVMPGLKLS